MKYLLGIDVGTTGTKSILFSEAGELIAGAYRPYDLLTKKVGYSEQSAEDWWRAVVETVREVCADPAMAKNVAGISLSLQGGTVVPVDERNVPLRPALVWNDARCAAQKEAFLKEVGDGELMYQKSGWKLGNGLPALEIRWLQENEPEIFAKTAMFLTVPDYIAVKMTGNAAVDLSDAGINQLCDIRTGAYDPDLLRFAGITEDKLPKILHSGEVIGHLTEQAAEALGLTTNAVLCAGAHDQYAVALGAGATKPGDILIGSGTAWVVTALGEKPDFDGGLAQSVSAVPGLWGSLLSLGSGGVCLEWWRRSLTVDLNGEKVPFHVIDDESARRHAAENGLFFYPFSGRCTAEKKFSKATVVGLDLSHDRFDLSAAIMEGVAFQAVWMMESFAVKPSAEGIKLAGGASKSPIWSRMLADITGLPVRIPEIADLACVGAAILAGVGCGIFRDAEEGYHRLAVKERVIQPNADAHAKYAQLFEQYKATAAALAPVYGI